jgi:trimethylguanosine synthase
MDTCPLGIHLQSYWDKLSIEEKQFKLDEEALYSIDPQEIACPIASTIRGRKVVDLFCGAGGMAIALARSGKLVTAVELNKNRLEMAKYNASIFKVEDKILFINGDSSSVIKSLEKCDAVFLDPPWGGVDYVKHEKMFFSDFSPDLYEIITLSFGISDFVMCKVPRNFDFSEFDNHKLEYRKTNIEFRGKLLYYCVYLEKK